MIQIAETFTSIQGEGHLTGKRMHFVRFAGCSVTQCGLHPKWFKGHPNGPGCDTDFSAKRKATPEELVAECLDAVGAGGWVCITGGEPCDQAEGLARLGMGLHEAGLRICLETSGTLPVPIKWDWISVSPKSSVENLKVRFGQEMKIVYRGQGLHELVPFYHQTSFWDYYLMPYDKPGEGPNTAQTIDAVHRANIEFAQDWKFCAQAHKDWGVR